MFFPLTTNLGPRFDWRKGEAGYSLKLDVSEKNDVDVNAVDGGIRIHIRNKNAEKTLNLYPPEDGNVEGVDAELYRGVLYLNLPYKESAHKQIAVRRIGVET